MAPPVKRGRRRAGHCPVQWPRAPKSDPRDTIRWKHTRVVEGRKQRWIPLDSRQMCWNWLMERTNPCAIFVVKIKEHCLGNQCRSGGDGDACNSDGQRLKLTPFGTVTAPLETRAHPFRVFPPHKKKPLIVLAHFFRGGKRPTTLPV